MTSTAETIAPVTWSPRPQCGIAATRNVRCPSVHSWFWNDWPANTRRNCSRPRSPTSEGPIISQSGLPIASAGRKPKVSSARRFHSNTVQVASQVKHAIGSPSKSCENRLRAISAM